MSTLPLSRELLVNNLPRVRGYLPTFKPKGVDITKVSEVLSHDIYFFIRANKINSSSGYQTTFARYLEPFADGLVTFIIGPNELRMSRYFALANFRYRTIVEFGVDRYNHTIDGDVISTSNVDHINSELINHEVETSFVGQCKQNRLKQYSRSPPEVIDETSQLADYYNKVGLFGATREYSQPELKTQKYPYMRPDRICQIDSIKLVSYNKPYGEFDISCQGCFTIRQFAVDLAAKLNTKASLVQLTRLKEGPVTVDDARLFKLHELNLEEYMFRHRSFRWTYDHFNQQMREVFENLKT